MRRVNTSHVRPDYGVGVESRTVSVNPEEWELFVKLQKSRNRTPSYGLRQAIRRELRRAKKAGELCD